MKYLLLILPLAVMAAENPLDCMNNAPASANQCKPGEAPRASVRIEVKSYYGEMYGSDTTEYCEVQHAWVVGGVCNYCRVTDEQCGET
jgi:hypothetical protein